MSISPDRLERYARHIMLREIGGAGQKRLAGAAVAIIGLGALGGPAALYLAAAGVGRLRLIDDDRVSLSNLQRQVLYRTADVGALKTEIALSSLEALNPDCRTEAVCERLTAANAASLLSGFGVVIDGSDTFASRFAANAACLELGSVFITAAVSRWSAQAGVFRAGLTRHAPAAERAPCYRCFVPEAPGQEETCAATGVAGPLTGIVGARLALEAVKEITGAGDTLDGRIWLFDGLSGEERTLRLSADPACLACGTAVRA